MSNLKPTLAYFPPSDLLAGVEREGPFREIGADGRTGINATSIHSRLTIPKHNINDDKGTLTLWVMPVEDLYSAAVPTFIDPYEPLYYMYTMLSDIPDMKNVTEASFALLWNSKQWRQLSAKFYKGNIFEDALYPDDLALASSGENVSLDIKKWYQIATTWNRSENLFRIFINGIPVGSAAMFAPKVVSHPCGDVLYAGNPSLALSDLTFYDRVLTEEELKEVFQQEATYIDTDIQEALLARHVGDTLPKYTWEPIGNEWQLKMDVPLNRPEDMDLFHIQGAPYTPRITDDGLLYETNMTRTEEAKVPSATPPPTEIYDPDQVYLWTNEFFEGDLAVEYEFMPLQKNGLSVLIVQASGMQHEDFVADYPRRTSGSMRIVWGENVRNYDWEYYREMDDVRHDIESHVLNKQPWGRQLAYQCRNQHWEQNVWHRIQFIQEGQRIRGTIDGTLIFDVKDDPYIQGGPTFNCGHVAIRCMWKKRLLVRNLKIYNKPLFPDAVTL